MLGTHKTSKPRNEIRGSRGGIEVSRNIPRVYEGSGGWLSHQQVGGMDRPCALSPAVRCPSSSSEHLKYTSNLMRTENESGIPANNTIFPCPSKHSLMTSSVRGAFLHLAEAYLCSSRCLAIPPVEALPSLRGAALAESTYLKQIKSFERGFRYRKGGRPRKFQQSEILQRRGHHIKSKFRCAGSRALRRRKG